MSLIHSLPTARETNVPGSSSSAVLNRERRETGVSSDSRSKRKGYIYILVVFREAAGFGRRARARCNPQRGPGYTRGGAASTWPSPAPLPFFSRASALPVVRTAGRNSFLYGYIFASSKRESSSAYPQGFLRPSPLLVPGCAALWTSGGSTDRTLFPLDPPISSLLFKKHDRETISSFVKTKTINIQRYLYHETFFSKQYITLLRIFRQIYIKQSQNGRRTTPSTEGVNGRGGNLANQFPYVVPQPLPSPVSGLPLNSVISPGCVARSINFFVPVARVPVHVHSSVVCTAGAHTHG